MTLRAIGVTLVGVGFFLLMVNLVFMMFDQPSIPELLFFQMAALGLGAILCLASSGMDKWREERPRPPVIREPPFDR